MMNLLNNKPATSDEDPGCKEPASIIAEQPCSRRSMMPRINRLSFLNPQFSSFLLDNKVAALPNRGESR
jgi:hypothetical protein